MHIHNVRFVLVRPRSADNLGAAARALKNFGIRDWVWVDPVAGVSPDAPGAAERLAVHAGDLLRSVRTVATLGEAVADCAWVVGTSSRPRAGGRRLSPREVAGEIARRQPAGSCAVVFGDERDGLRRAELQHCHDVSAIRADADQPSLNLAQAVLLYAYEVHEAARGGLPDANGRLSLAADDATLTGVEEALRRAMAAHDLLSGGERHAVRDLFGSLRRSRLSRPEAELWLATLHRLARGRPPAG